MAEEGQHDAFGIVGTIQARVFKVERAVAEGGFGVVYRAHHEVFRSPVALKCLKLPDHLTAEQKTEFLERFRSEAELLFRLSAALPEVVRPLQFGVLDAGTVVPFLALEWLEGETLDSFVEKRAASGKPPIGVSAALETLAPVARVLARAHQFNDRGNDIAIIHRDVKPENVFLAESDGERVTRILDFGIARVRAETNAMAGKATGVDALNAFSPAYAAPEQWSPETYGTSGPWTDVYGLALTLTEVLIGRPPIGGDITAMMGAALNPDFRPTPRNRGVKVPDNVEKAIQKALAVDPKQRTQTIEAFWTQLEVAQGRSPSITKRHSHALLSRSEPPPPDLELELPAAPAPAAPPPAPAAARMPAAAAPAPLAPPLAESSGLSLSLDLQVSPRAARPSPSPRRASSAAVGPAWGNLHEAAAPSKTFGERFGGPAWLIVLAMAVAGGDIILKQTTGESLSLGPVRPLYIAGPLGVLGIVLILIRLVDD